ncbi:MAG: alpha/beta hydrolase [Firmicutes bacterium]|nr:alpha/beta hydrolase [Bacillota bacterium]
MTIQVDGIELFYEKVGEGRPLVMLHGNGEDHTIFREASEVLKDAFTCYLVDSRGHGQSQPVTELHYDEMAEDITAFIAKLGLQDVILYGFSDGGIVGLMAARQCDAITDLIVSGANLTPRGLKTGCRIRLWLEYLLRHDTKVRMMLREPQMEEESLRSIRAKTLVLAGSRDLIAERETKRIAGAVPGAELRILKGENHGSYIVHQTRIAELIRDFCLPKSC